jgi:hypothetical protein
MKTMMWAVFFLMLGGCASKPPELLFADGSGRIPVHGARTAVPPPDEVPDAEPAQPKADPATKQS